MPRRYIDEARIANEGVKLEKLLCIFDRPQMVLAFSCKFITRIGLQEEAFPSQSRPIWNVHRTWIFDVFQGNHEPLYWGRIAAPQVKDLL